jgi:hypothetical protein
VGSREFGFESLAGVSGFLGHAEMPRHDCARSKIPACIADVCVTTGDADAAAD